MTKFPLAGKEEEKFVRVSISKIKIKENFPHYKKL